MTTTVTTSTSWFSRVGNSIKNVFFGFLLVMGSIVLLFWNEGRAVKTEQSLKEGASVVISVKADSKDPINEGKLIHFSGPAKTPGMLSDSEFGVNVSALKLRRIVEVYQWEEDSRSETTEKLGGGTDTSTTYTYKKTWNDQIIDSSTFQEKESHQNPQSKAFENKEWLGQNISVGSFVLTNELLESLSGYTPYTITQEMLNTLPYSTQEKLELVGNRIYFKTENSTEPAIGDTRISYEYIAPQDISVIAKQSGDSLAAYVTSNGRSISMIQLGRASARKMFDTAVSNNKLMTWIIRFAGTLLMYIGLNLVFGVLPIIAAVIPFIGRVVGVGISLFSGLLTLVGSSLTIGIAWIFYRPLVGGTLFIIAAIGVFFIIRSLLAISPKR